MKWSKRLAEIDKLRAKHGKQRPNRFPDLSVQHNVAPLGNVLAPVVNYRRAAATSTPAGFVIGNLHKQGHGLHSVADLPYTGGRKS